MIESISVFSIPPIVIYKCSVFDFFFFSYSKEST